MASKKTNIFILEGFQKKGLFSFCLVLVFFLFISALLFTPLNTLTVTKTNGDFASSVSKVDFVRRVSAQEGSYTVLYEVVPPGTGTISPISRLVLHGGTSTALDVIQPISEDYSFANFSKRGGIGEGRLNPITGEVTDVQSDMVIEANFESMPVYTVTYVATGTTVSNPIQQIPRGGDAEPPIFDYNNYYIFEAPFIIGDENALLDVDTGALEDVQCDIQVNLDLRLIISQPPASLTTSIYNENALDLSWGLVPGVQEHITGYRIERRPTGGTWTTIVANTNSTNRTYRNTGLSENTSYQYRVAAINSVGTVGTYRTGNDTWTGHCQVVTGSCPVGYTSRVGGASTSCATQGPVTSPYQERDSIRYRIATDGAVHTNGSCQTGVRHQYRRAQISSNSGSTYSTMGTVTCRTQDRGNICQRMQRCKRYSSGSYYSCSCNYTDPYTRNCVCSASGRFSACRWTITNTRYVTNTLGWCCRT